MKMYSQSVDGVVNLIGGEDVGLSSPMAVGRAVVREVGSTPVEIGWMDDGEKFIPPFQISTVPALTELQILSQKVDEQGRMLMALLIPEVPLE